MNERSVQRSILKMMGKCFPPMFVAHVPNGAHLGGGRQARARQMGALKGDGLKVGFPDLVCLWNGKAYFMEVKNSEGGKLSDVQKETLERLEGMGFPVAVVTSDKEAFDFLKANAAPWSGVEV